MSKTLIRFFAILLVACLVADPTLAMGFSPPSLNDQKHLFLVSTSSEIQSSFQEQALTLKFAQAFTNSVKAIWVRQQEGLVLKKVGVLAARAHRRIKEKHVDWTPDQVERVVNRYVSQNTSELDRFKERNPNWDEMLKRKIQEVIHAPYQEFALSFSIRNIPLFWEAHQFKTLYQRSWGAVGFVWLYTATALAFVLEGLMKPFNALIGYAKNVHLNVHGYINALMPVSLFLPNPDSDPFKEHHLRLAEATSAHLRIVKRVLPKNNAIAQLVDEQLGRITTDPEAQVFILQDDSDSAFALPNKHIFISLGFLKQLGTLEEVQALLLHEWKHIKDGHAVERLRSIPEGDILGQIGVVRANEFIADAEMMLEADRLKLNSQGAILLNQTLHRMIKKESEERENALPGYIKREKANKQRFDLEGMDPTHGSAESREGNLRELTRFVDLIYLSPEVTPVDWNQLSKTRPDTQNSQNLSSDPTIFWRQLYIDLSRDAQLRFSDRLQALSAEVGISLKDDEAQTLEQLFRLLLVTDIRKSQNVKLPLEKQKMIEAFDTNLLPQLMSGNVLAKLGYPLMPADLLLIGELQIRQLFRQESDRIKRAEALKEIRDSAIRLHDRLFGATFYYPLAWDTQMLITLILAMGQNGDSVQVITTKRKTKVRLDSAMEEEEMEIPYYSFSGPIPFQAVDPEELYSYWKAAEGQMADLPKLETGVLESLGVLEAKATDTPLAKWLDDYWSDEYQRVNSLIVHALKPSIEDINNSIPKRITPIEAMALKLSCTGSDSVSPILSDRAASQRNLFLVKERIRKENLGDRMSANAQYLWLDLMDDFILNMMESRDKIDKANPAELWRQEQRLFRKLQEKADGPIAFYRMNQLMNAALWVPNDERLQETEAAKALLMELLANSSKQSVLSRINAFGSGKILTFMENVIKERQSLGIGRPITLNRESYAGLKSIQARRALLLLDRLSKLRSPDILEEARKAVDDFPFAFPHVDDAVSFTDQPGTNDEGGDITHEWRRDKHIKTRDDANNLKLIENKIQQLLRNNPDFPASPEDLDSLLSVTCITEGGWEAMNFVSVLFERLVDKSTSFDQAFAYYNKYKHLPRVLLQPGVDVLLGRFVREKSHYQQLLDVMQEQLSLLQEKPEDIVAAEMSQSVARFIGADDKLELFKLLLSTSQGDEQFKMYLAKSWWSLLELDYKRQMFDIVQQVFRGTILNRKQDIELSKIKIANEMELPPLAFERTFRALYQLEPAMVYLLMRGLALEGQKALFRSENDRRELLREYVRTYIQFDENGGNKEQQKQWIEDIVEVLATKPSAEDLFFFTGPFLAHVALQRPDRSTPEEPILNFLHDKALEDMRSRGIMPTNPRDRTNTLDTMDRKQLPQQALDRILMAYMRGVRPELQSGQLGQPRRLIFPEQNELAFIPTVLDRLGAGRREKERAFARQRSPLKLAVDIAQETGALAVRLLQLIGLYFDLSPTDRATLRTVYDRVRGQTSVQAFNVLQREADRSPQLKPLFDALIEFGEILGGGSIVTVFKGKMSDGQLKAIGIKNPNAEYRAWELLQFAESIIDGLMGLKHRENDPDLPLLKLLLREAYRWVLAEIRDIRYEENNRRFTADNDVRSTADVRYQPDSDNPWVLKVPTMDETGTDWIRWEDCITAEDLLSWEIGPITDRQKRQISVADAKAIVAAIAQNYAYQLFESGLVHSDLHLGQFLIDLEHQDEQGRRSIYILDRKNLFRFDEGERDFLMQLLMSLASGSNMQGLFDLAAPHFLGERAQDAELIGRIQSRMGNTTGLPTDKLFLRLLLALQAEGIHIDLKWELVPKNLLALDQMSRWAGFSDLFIALFYSPETKTPDEIFHRVLPTKASAFAGVSPLTTPVTRALANILGIVDEFDVGRFAARHEYELTRNRAEFVRQHNHDPNNPNLSPWKNIVLSVGWMAIRAGAKILQPILNLPYTKANILTHEIINILSIAFQEWRSNRDFLRTINETWGRITRSISEGSEHSSAIAPASQTAKTKVYPRLKGRPQILIAA